MSEPDGRSGAHVSEQEQVTNRKGNAGESRRFSGFGFSKLTADNLKQTCGQQVGGRSYSWILIP